jgi:hypothetical protein
MKLIDATVPLDAKLPTYPRNVPFGLQAAQRIAQGDQADVPAFQPGAPADHLLPGAGVIAVVESEAPPPAPR